MLYKIICKVTADTEEEAVDIVQSELEETVNDLGNFDYVDDGTTVIHKKDLSTWNAKSFEELEEAWGNLSRQQHIDRELSMIRDDVRIILAEKHLLQEDLPLLIDAKNCFGKEDKAMIKIVEKKLKSGEEGTLPKSFNELLDVVMGLVEDFSNLGLFSYRLTSIRKVRDCIQFPNSKYELMNCHDNHFADLTCDYPDGENTYYVIGSRHS